MILVVLEVVKVSGSLWVRVEQWDFAEGIDGGTHVIASIYIREYQYTIRLSPLPREK